MDEYIKKEDAIEAVTSLFRVSALFSGMNDNEEEWREKAEKVLAKCEVVTNIVDTPQTDYPCNTCVNKGDHDGECQNCIVDSTPIRWKTPSNYKSQMKGAGNDRTNVN